MKDKKKLVTIWFAKMTYSDPRRVVFESAEFEEKAKTYWRKDGGYPSILKKGDSRTGFMKTTWALSKKQALAHLEMFQRECVNATKSTLEAEERDLAVLQKALAELK